MGKIVAIGGVTPPSTIDLIDKEIIELTGKKSPKMLYVPTAGGDDLRNYDFYKTFYGERFGCNVDILFLIKETPTEDQIRQKVLSSDIIYVEGGSESRLMDYFRKFGLDKILEEAYKKGIVLAGKSAGAICWGNYYFENDDINEFDEYSKVDCLKFINFIICPHYNLEGYAVKMEKMVKAYNEVGIALDNDCAIEIIDDSYRVMATRESANAYKVYKYGEMINKEIISKDCNFVSINKLINISAG